MLLHIRFKVFELGVSHSLVVREINVCRIHAQNGDVGVRPGPYDQAFQLLRTGAGRTKRHKKRYSERKKATRHRQKYAGFVPQKGAEPSINLQNSGLTEIPIFKHQADFPTLRVKAKCELLVANSGWKLLFGQSLMFED
jgi:hypothetical protein